ncbi:MAG: protoporphyrinogen oxidase [Myxococcaceae bacterium]
MKVVVVGGGISGLATAHALMERGLDVKVLEAQHRVGGVIASTDRDGFITEHAANGFVDREPAMRTLLSTLKLEDRLRPATPASKERFVFTRGALRQVPTSPPTLLRSEILPWSAKLRLLAEPFSARGNAEDESLAEFGRRHLGRGATDVLLDAVQTGVFAGDIERLSVSATFPMLAELERKHRSLLLGFIREMRARRRSPSPSLGMSGVLSSFEGGMETLPATLSGALGDRVRTRAPVEKLERAGDGWRVVSKGEAIEADRVVLAAPAFASAELLRPHSSEAAKELAAIPYAPIAVVHLGFRHPTPTARGFGFIVPAQEQRDVLGAMHVSSFFPWRAPSGATLLTVMVGGARRPELVALDDDSLVAKVRKELGIILGLDRPPDEVRVVRWFHGIPQYVVGHLARVQRIEEQMRALPGVFLTGAGYRGVGVNDCVRNAALLAELIAR